MINKSDYNFITDQLASAQQQSYNALEKLSDMRAQLTYVESFVGSPSPANVINQIDVTYSHIITYEITNTYVEKMTVALQRHILAHWD